MRIWGVSCQFHDAAITVIEDGVTVFAAHSERYSKKKNDAFLNQEIVAAAYKFGKPDKIVLHEKYWLKCLRQSFSGDFGWLDEPSAEKWITKFYPQLRGIPITSYSHHQTHAAAGALTSGFDEAAVIVVDAVGEFDTSSIWRWQGGKLRKLSSVTFPDSLGMFYSAVTGSIGLKPMEDEYILMGMAALGDDTRALETRRIMEKLYVDKSPAPSHPMSPLNEPDVMRFKVNFQKGLPFDLDLSFEREVDIAKATQNITEDQILGYARKAKRITGISQNLVFMGGVALNCVANSKLWYEFDNVHIMPNPGDAGSSFGAAALKSYETTGKLPKFPTPYLGHNIEGDYPVDKALSRLLNGEIIGIANGRAEFGPRALGNRSLIADPRGGEIKSKLNDIKQRQGFRPFAPVILEDHVHEYFQMPRKCKSSPYMQFVAKCLQPKLFPAIVHVDGTSRVQTVNKNQHPGLHKLLTRFHQKTGCPMLLNTSLNIKGMPIVNDEHDANAFSKYYGVPVLTKDDK